MGFFSLPLPLPRHESEQSVPGSDNGLVMESVFPSGVSERERERERERGMGSSVHGHHQEYFMEPLQRAANGPWHWAFRGCSALCLLLCTLT
jgi:hypothetical protein